ncbi:MAG: hypothetical protein ABR884_03445 [Minisyncoccia bacterium]
MRHPSSNEGQSFLALVIFIGGIVAVAGLLIAFFAVSLVDTGYGVAAAYSAESTATAGAEDGLLQLDRNAQFSNPSGYSVAAGTSTTATVAVTQNSPSSGFATILSAATVSSHTKKIQIVVSVNGTTGAVNIVSWTDVQ